MSDPNDPAEDEMPGTGDLRAEAFTWDAPDRSLLSGDFGDAPRFPTDMLGLFWSHWVALSARSANPPVDYTAGTLLATVGAMLGNVRWPNVEGVWEHPCVLWIGLVGNPSTAKSPGMRPVRKLSAPDPTQQVRTRNSTFWDRRVWRGASYPVCLT